MVWWLACWTPCLRVAIEIPVIREMYLRVSVRPRPCCTDHGWKGTGKESKPGVYLHRRQLLHVQLLLLLLVFLQRGLVKAKLSYDTAYKPSPHVRRDNTEKLNN